MKHKLFRTHKLSRRFKKQNKTEPIHQLHISDQQEPAFYRTKKYLIELDKQMNDIYSVIKKDNIRYESDCSLTQWNNEYASLVNKKQMTKQGYNKNDDRPKGQAKNKSQSQREYAIENNHRDKYKMITSRYKFDRYNSQKQIINGIGISDEKQKQISPKSQNKCNIQFKSLNIKQIFLNVKIQHQKNKKISQVYIKKQILPCQKEIVKINDKKLPLIDRLHGIPAGQYKNKFNFIFRHKRKNPSTFRLNFKKQTINLNSHQIHQIDKVQKINQISKVQNHHPHISK